MAVETVSTFVLPNEYQRQAAEARRRRRMAELMAQQAYQPGDIQNAPIPAAAPLVQGLQAFLTARQMRKAEEAEERASAAAERAGADITGYLFGGGRKPGTVADLTEVTPAGRLTPQVTPTEADLTGVTPAGRLTPQRTLTEADLTGMTPAGRLTPQRALTEANLTGVTPAGELFPTYKQDPNAALRAALTPAGGAAMKGNPLLAAMLAKTMEKPQRLEIGAVNPADFTSESLAEAQRTGDVGALKLRTQPAAAPKTAAQDTMQWNPTTQSWEDIPGAVERIGDIAAAKRPDVVVTGGGDGKERLERILGPDGKAILVPRSQAINKEPAPAPTEKQKMPGGVATNIASLKTKAKQFGAGVERANYFRNLIANNQLPLSVTSNLQYSFERAMDPGGTARDSKGNKPAYVLYAELNRFVTEQVNTILQLAKGTQTEGDALRAQRQILDEPNNSAVVLSALDDLQRAFATAQQYANEEADFLLDRYESAPKVEEVDY